MHKFRIKCRVFLDGSTDYTPQYKGWFFWYGFTDNYSESTDRFATLQGAQQYITMRIADERARTVISTSITYNCPQHQA